MKIWISATIALIVLLFAAIFIEDPSGDSSTWGLLTQVTKWGFIAYFAVLLYTMAKRIGR